MGTPERRDKEAKVKFADRSSPSERSWELMREMVFEAFTKQKEDQDRVTKRLEAVAWLLLIGLGLFSVGMLAVLIKEIWT